MKIGIVTFEQMEGKPYNSIGGSRIRGNWLAEAWDEAEIYQPGTKYDVLIFQKAYFMSMLREFEGIKIFDICDPDWMINRPIAEVDTLIDAWSCPTEALAEWLRQFSSKPVFVIPDRLKLSDFKSPKYHEGRAKMAVWFGYAQNQEVLHPILPAIKRADLDLLVVSEDPQDIQLRGTDIGLTVQHRKFSPETMNHDIQRGDIVIMPNYETLPELPPRFKFKSNNKTITAWALGMPVATTLEELDKFMDEGERRAESKRVLEEVKNYDISKSVEEFRQAISEIQAKKGG